MEGEPEWKRWGRGSPAGRRAGAFEGWGLSSSAGGMGDLERQKNGEWRNEVVAWVEWEMGE